MDPVRTYITISYVTVLVSFIIMCLFWGPPESDDESWVVALIMVFAPLSFPIMCSYGIVRAITGICNYLNAD